MAAATLAVPDVSAAEYGEVADLPVQAKVADLAGGQDGNLYALVQGSAAPAVVRFTVGGGVEEVFALPPAVDIRWRIARLDVAPDGAFAVLVKESSGGHLWTFGPDGEAIADWGLRASSMTEFFNTRDIAIDGERNVYLAYSRITAPPITTTEHLVKHAPDGTPLSELRPPAAATALDFANGELHVLVRNGVLRYGPGGERRGGFAADGAGTNPMDLAVDGDRILVLRFRPEVFDWITPNLTPGFAGVELFDASGPIDEFGCFGRGPGRVSGAAAVAFDETGRPVVADDYTLKVFDSGVGSSCVLDRTSAEATLEELGGTWTCPFDACDLTVTGYVRIKGTRSELTPASARLAEDVSTFVRHSFVAPARRRLVRKLLKRRPGHLELQATATDAGGRTATMSTRLRLVAER